MLTLCGDVVNTINRLGFLDVPSGMSVPEDDWQRLLQTTVTMARFDERLAHVPASVREGWSRRALVHEAVASLRLDGVYVTTEDLFMVTADSLDRAGDQNLIKAVRIHQMLEALLRRNPNNLFKADRLIALSRLRTRTGLSLDSRLPAWLRESIAHPEELKPTLQDALDPDAVANWRRLPALVGCASVLARWHNSGAADRINGASGRALAMAWAYRAGLTSGYHCLPAIGFLSNAADYRPDLEGRWQGLFLQAATRASEWSVKLLSHLTAVHRRIREYAPAEKSTSRMMALVEMLVSRPVVSPRSAARELKVTTHGARAMLKDLEGRGLVREMTGRGSYRLYTATAF
jgi:HTH DNA binding domain